MKRSVAITQPARLKLDKTRLAITIRAETHTVPIEDLSLLVLDHDAIDITGPLLGELGERGVAVIACNSKHLPSLIAIPFTGHSLMPSFLRRQVEAAVPVRKRIWQTLIVAKIQSQAGHLRAVTGSTHRLDDLSRRVLSGDTSNREAVAAAIYFEALFGKEFTRSRGFAGEDCADEERRDRLINAMLNYGYAVLRAAVARSVVLAGLQPALGLHHRHRENDFALADDLMEPLRVLVDRLVIDRIREEEEWPEDLTPALKRHVLQLLTAEVGWEGGQWPLDSALEAYAAGVRSCLFRETNRVAVPIA